MQSKSSALASTILVLAMTLAGLSLPKSVAAQQATGITIGIIGKTSTAWPWFVAQKMGYFEKYGLRPQIISIDSSAACTQQLAAGSLDVGAVSPTNIIEAIRGGANVQYVLSVLIVPPFSLYVKNNIRSLGDLRDKTIIVGGSGDVTHMFLDAMLKAGGLKPSDYTLTYAGATNARFAALKSGSVDAALLLPPFSFLAEADGYRNLGTVKKYVGSFPLSGIAASGKWLDGHAASMVALGKVYVESMRWLENPANKSAAVQILVDVTNANNAEAVKTYDELVSGLHAFSHTGLTANADMAKVVAALVDLRQLDAPAPPAGQFYNNKFVQQANNEFGSKR
jgi:NitT/TauT family transport system substrate-binding protein